MQLWVKMIGFLNPDRNLFIKLFRIPYWIFWWKHDVFIKQQQSSDITVLTHLNLKYQTQTWTDKYILKQDSGSSQCVRSFLQILHLALVWLTLWSVWVQSVSVDRCVAQLHLYYTSPVCLTLHTQKQDRQTIRESSHMV